MPHVTSDTQAEIGVTMTVDPRLAGEDQVGINGTKNCNINDILPGIEWNAPYLDTSGIVRGDQDLWNNCKRTPTCHR